MEAVEAWICVIIGCVPVVVTRNGKPAHTSLYRCHSLLHTCHIALLCTVPNNIAKYYTVCKSLTIPIRRAIKALAIYHCLNIGSDIVSKEWNTHLTGLVCLWIGHNIEVPLAVLCNLFAKHKVKIFVVNALEEEWIAICCHCNLILCRGGVVDKLRLDVARKLVNAAAVGLNHAITIGHSNICHRVATLVANGTGYWWKVAQLFNIYANIVKKQTRGSCCSCTATNCNGRSSRNILKGYGVLLPRGVVIALEGEVFLVNYCAVTDAIVACQFSTRECLYGNVLLVLVNCELVCIAIRSSLEDNLQLCTLLCRNCVENRCTDK